MKNNIELLSETLVGLAKKHGATSADSIVMTGESLSIEVREKTLEKAERSEGIDLGLRVFVDKKSACVSASNDETDTLNEMAFRAVAMAKEAPSDEFNGLAQPSELSTNSSAELLELCDSSKIQKDPKVLQDLSLSMEEASRLIDGVTQCESSGATASYSKFHMFGSNGFSGGYEKTSYQLYCSAIAGNGSNMERDYSAEARTFFSDLPDPALIGSEAGERAIKRLNPKQPPTGKYPVIFDTRVSSSLVGHIMSAINGAAIARGSSWLRDKMEMKILPSSLSITEDPFRKKIFGSRPFDGEGLPVTRRSFIKNGVLKSWILDLHSARKLNLHSTGNASRSISSQPAPSVGNIELTTSSLSYNDLLKKMETGLLITSFIGSTINPTTGDYSRGASGFWVESGEIAYPVNECTIAGNLNDMIRNIIPANDVKWHLSYLIPSILIDGLTIAGR
jgi:PmbA protein